MSDFKIDFTSNMQKVLDELNQKCESAMQKIGENAVNFTVQAIEGNLGMERAVLTGRLKNSIRYATNDKSGYSYVYFDDEVEWFTNDIPKINESDPVVYIGTEVPYAEQVYFGYGYHAHKGARKFLNYGIGDSKNYWDIWENILKFELQK